MTYVTAVLLFLGQKLLNSGTQIVTPPSASYFSNYLYIYIYNNIYIVVGGCPVISRGKREKKICKAEKRPKVAVPTCTRRFVK